MFAAGKDLWDVHMMWHFHLMTKFVQEFSNVFQIKYDGMKRFLDLAGVEFTCDLESKVRGQREKAGML